MIGYIARGSTFKLSGFPKILGFPGSTPKDIVVKVSGKVRKKYIVSKL